MQHTLLAADIAMISIPMLVWAIYAGIVIGILAMYYNKVVLGRAIRALLEKGAIGEEAAVSAEDLGFAKNPLILRSIDKGALGRYVHRRKKEEDGTLLYYLTEENRIRAELRYSNKGTDLYVVVIALILFTMVAFLAARYLPDLLETAKDLMS